MKKHSTFKEILVCAIVLMVIAGISGISLGLVSQITYVSEQEAEARALNKYFQGSFEKVATDGTTKLFKGTNEGQEFYVSMANGLGGYSGDVVMLAKFEGDVITEVYAGSNLETIKEPFKPFFIEKFVGKNVADIEGFTLDGADSSKISIDKVAGATKSSTAIVDGVDKCVAIYKAKIGG